MAEVNSWDRARLVRAYAAERVRSLGTDGRENMKEWAKWANDVADRLNPLKALPPREK